MCDLAWVRIFFPQTSGDRFKGVTPRANGHNIVGQQLPTLLAQQCLELLRPFPRSLRKPMKDCLFSVRIFYFSLGISLQEFFSLEIGLQDIFFHHPGTFYSKN